MSSTLYTWEFSDKKDRSPIWYMVILSIAIGLVIWGFITNQYGMSFVILLLVGLIYFVENNSDDIVKASITDLGIKVGDGFYNYGNIDSFTLVYEGENAILLRLNMNKRGLKQIDIDINNSITLNIKNILSNYLEENPKGNLTIIERLIRKAKL